MRVQSPCPVRRNREVTYYASELCIAPKYLSEISKSITGNSANWWINRFTVLDISRQLRDRSLSFVDISEMFNFSSPAYCKHPTKYVYGIESVTATIR